MNLPPPSAEFWRSGSERCCGCSPKTCLSQLVTFHFRWTSRLVNCLAAERVGSFSGWVANCFHPVIFSVLAARVVSRSIRSLKRKSWARLCDCCCDLVPQAVKKAFFRILITPTPGGA